MRERFPLPGMRTIKTAVAVMISLVIFLPMEALSTAEGTNFIDQLGPFYACIAAIVCMQSSVGATWKQGVSRLLGTLIGQQVPKKKETNPGGQGQTTAQDGDEVSPDAPRDESAQSLGQEDDHEKH